ncbi:hypothetical protein J4Q44_G00220550 [Coregonus suidteri]|uniref:Uncharacterized protein n=1 Tax=Coregonus suidteri TaxID=861788 RepID=A0AAN8QZ14_9TELE
MWKLFFQNNAAVLDQALLDYSSMNPNISSPAMPNVLDAIGEIKINNFNPGCVSNTSGSMDWLQRNFGIFSVFAELQELQVLNPDFSSKESLSLLTPTQVAQLTLTSGALNDTADIKLVFMRLEEGDAFKNVDEFLTILTAKEEIPDIYPAVRDVMMNLTFNIISLQFPKFETLDWIAWFEVKLIPILPSFNEVMLTIATSNVTCTNYQVIVKGMDRAFPEMTEGRREGIAGVLLKYLRISVHLINEPVCRLNIHNDTDWLAINLGPYSKYTTYSDLKDFNISGVAVLDSLSPNQKAELILDPSTGALENETLENITIITNTAVRDTMLNLTLMALAPKFDVFEPKDFQLWFQVNLVVLLASFNPGRLVVIPLNITCESYNAIFTGLDQSLQSLPPHLSQGVESSLEALMKTFQHPGCVSNTSGSMDWLQRNFGIFSVFAELQELQVLNPDFSSVAVLDSLSPNQKAELILDPSTGALENETLVKKVFISLLESPREEQLNEFFVTFVEVTKQIHGSRPKFAISSASPLTGCGVKLGSTDEDIPTLLKASSFNCDPGCVSNTSGSMDWLQRNFGIFSVFAELQELQVLNPDFSSKESLSLLTPTQVAQLTLTSGALNDTADIKLVFMRLEEGDAFKNVDEFLTILTAKEEIPDIYPAVRDVMMNLTFNIISLQFPKFETLDWIAWFEVKLIPILPSFNEVMLTIATSNVTCTNYQVIVKGMDRAFPEMTEGRREGIAGVLLKYLRISVHLINEPVCRLNIHNDTDWLAINLGPYSKYTTYSDLKDFNISGVAVLDSLSPNQKAELILDPSTGALENETLVKKVFISLLESPREEQLNEFFVTFVEVTKQENITIITNTAVRDTMLNLTLMALAPKFDVFEPKDFQLWFQVNLVVLLASFNPGRLVVIPLNITCESYNAIFTGLDQSLQSLPPHLSQGVESSLEALMKTFQHPGCVSNTSGSMDWLQRNFGIFSVFAELQELQVLNPDFSSVAQLTLTSGALNDTADIKLVFMRLEEGDAFKNVDEFLTILTAKEEIPDIYPAVRDVMMNLTFNIISLQFPKFETLDWIAWFEVKLIPILPSFNEVMLTIATSNVTCTNYQVIVKGMDRAFPEMTEGRREGIAGVLLKYLRISVHLINEPVCRLNIHDDTDWLAINLGPFSKYTTYSDLKDFNISGVAVLDSLSPNQKAELILDPTNLANGTLVQEVFLLVLGSSDVAEIGPFFQSFVEVASKSNLTAIEPGLRDTLLNLTLTALAPKLQTLDTQGFKLWFQVYLPLFLPSINPGTFSVIPRNISCDSYSAIIKGCDNVVTRLSLMQSQQVFMFTKDYLTGQSIEGFSCVKTVRDDRDWLGSYFGQFRIYASYVDFVTLKSDFNGVNVADLLTPIQLAQLAVIPSQLKGAQGVNKIMAAIGPANFGLFFDILSPAIQKHMNNYTEEVKTAFLQVVFDSGDLSSTAINDTEFLVWLRVRLNPLLLNLSSNQVTPLFRIMKDRGCNSSQEAISLLDTLRSTLTEDTQREIYSNTLLLLKEPTPLRCYVNGSFYSFLRSTFLGFGFPDLSMLFTLMPDTRQPELLNSITCSELSQFLSQPDVVGNGSNICAVFKDYAKTPVFLETEDVSDAVKQLTLPCVWPLALSSGNRSEVNAWFDLRLKNYLRFLTRSLISSSTVQNGSCLAFQKLVSVLGSDFSYNSSDFAQSDVYTTIKTYLGTGSGSKCYNANDPELNSTAWFVNYIGAFVTYLSLEDLNTFVTTSQINVFLENQANIKLFNNTAIPANVTAYYITQLYTLNPTFNPLLLPGFFLCEVPSTAYNSLSQTASRDILDRLKLFCNGTEDPQVSAALVANFQTITASTIATMGNSSTGLTTTQISSVSSSVLVSSLATLGSVSGWNLGQASTVIQTITTGGFQINTAASLISLGTLIVGIPSATITSIPATELLTASQSSVFVTNMLAGPQILQETYISKIITINQSPNALVVNVPDAMATLIPRVLLTFSEETVNVQAINRKTWTQEQAVIFFGTIASNASIDSEELSPSVLQGFTCTSVQSLTIKTVRRLVHACRPKILREKVVLKETQLTCMYNLLKGNLSQNFTDYPSDLLLYYNYAKVEKSNCGSYFSAAGSADFSVLSSVLNKDTMLLDNAKSCLGISGVSLSKNNVEVLGNMVCTMDGSYIQNSDPFILEKLKNCKDFTDAQVTAMEKLLLSGTTQYGNTATWNQQTLEDLGTLPLYLTQNFWSLFTREVKGKFLKSFMPQLRKQETQKRKLKTLFKEINSLRRSKRGAGCTTGNITQSVIADTSFPFGYDVTQFDLCLDTSILKDNLATVTERVDDNDFQKIILVKLNQAYPSGIVDEQLKVLHSVSRVATLDDITKWTVTKIDTLSALMASGDGSWETAKSKAIITTYLNTSGNSLGSSELNAIGSNLCSLDVSVLKTITSSSLKNANSLDVTSCSIEQKRAVYNISKSSFSSQRTANTTYYQLISPYLGGAPIEDVRSLAAQNVNMDITTFTGLEIAVVTSLTVSEVKGLLGTNVDDLKTFENDTVVQAWVAKQLQSDLDTLGLGLTGGKAASTVVVPAVVDPLNTTTTTTTPAHTTVTVLPLPATTTLDGVADGGVHPEKDLVALSLCLALVTIILQMM